MSVAIDERAYARRLRDSARETRLQIRDRDMLDFTNRNYGRLKKAVLGAIGDDPQPVAAIAARLGRDKGNVICVLRRLETDGLAARAGTTTNPHGQSVTLWLRVSSA